MTEFKNTETNQTIKDDGKENYRNVTIKAQISDNFEKKVSSLLNLNKYRIYLV